MDQLPPFGRGVFEVLGPTFAVYEKLLLAQEANIRKTRHETRSYGGHSRQQLDIYYPDRAATGSLKARPVLAFFYGGGFVQGDKVYENYANGLILGNIGHYFAREHGITVIIADYRLMAHGAKYPSGGEDVELVVDWIKRYLAKQTGYESIDLYLLGNSAGGVHVGTYILDPTFAESREKLMATERKGAGVLLRGAILLSAPMHWGEEDNEILRAYFGEGKIYANSPAGLLEAAKKEHAGPQLPGLKILLLQCELDTEFILKSIDDFQKAWPGDNLEVQTIKGHNHISPQLSLGTGIGREEAWGVQVEEFILSTASR